MGDVLPPLHSPYAALKAMQFPPQQKPGKLRGLPLNRSKKYPLPVNGCHPRPAAEAVCLFSGFWVAGRIALPLRFAMSELWNPEKGNRSKAEYNGFIRIFTGEGHLAFPCYILP